VRACTRPACIVQRYPRRGVACRCTHTLLHDACATREHHKGVRAITPIICSPAPVSLRGNTSAARACAPACVSRYMRSMCARGCCARTLSEWEQILHLGGGLVLYRALTIPAYLCDVLHLALSSCLYLHGGIDFLFVCRGEAAEHAEQLSS